MNAFETHTSVINSYRSYLKSFINIKDEKVAEVVDKALESDGFLPDPLVQFNPAFQSGIPLQTLVSEGVVNRELPKVFGDYTLYKHQIEALKLGIAGSGFIVTSGTGSGKSLTYLATIFNDLFNLGDKKKTGVKAILVYPMNALINSQYDEIAKYKSSYEKKTGRNFPVTFERYTGQEGKEIREDVKNNPPDIILTNYMMLELIMTRQPESWMRASFSQHLKYLVFDELHTYRGRQGSDVSLLVRRLKHICQNEILTIGTSATMASGGTPTEKKLAVAEVAEKIFGTTYKVDQIINESLEYCTEGRSPSKVELKEAIKKEVDFSLGVEALRSNPIAIWLETEIALKTNEGTLERGKPLSMPQISILLAESADVDIVACQKPLIDILKWAEQINENNRLNGNRLSLLPFRFHQFISQTSIVSATLESRKSRSISITPNRYFKDGNEENLLFPLLFSRISGIDFICVEKDVEKHLLKPRNPDNTPVTITQKDFKDLEPSEELFKDGYIVLDEGEEFWEDFTGNAYLEFLPSSWVNKTGTETTTFYTWLMPKPIFFDKKGNYSSTPDVDKLKGWYIPAKLRIDPTAGVVYDDIKTSENFKLNKLGNEGRSTATTISSLSILNSLANQNVEVKDQKLLSFTDNRQDAALQAGHFNDFIATIRLRSALAKTLEENPDGLNIDNIHERVFTKLNLKESDYAHPNRISTDQDFPDERNGQALKKYLLYRILQDLKRGWRYTLPNLEQTALLEIDYYRLEKLAALPDRFELVPLLKEKTDGERAVILKQVLNYFRTNFSFDHRMLVDPSERYETQNMLKDRLDSGKLWSLDQEERLDAPRYMTIFNPGRTQRGIYTSSIGERSGIGKYIKRLYSEAGLSLSTDETRESIANLCEVLKGTGFLSEHSIKGANAPDGVKGYLLRSDAIIWKAGDKLSVELDEVRTNAFKDFKLKPNQFFQDIYSNGFDHFKKEISGAEHTGQLNTEDRLSREADFKEGAISSLFCSPTMELGIDIANLNIVHMRNVPPNPANYAQRGGRAGRGGQTALVFTYCSSYSPHDQHYFKNASEMVAGQVVPPRIDLMNEELIKTHLHAFILMKLEIGALHQSVSELVELSQTNYPLKESISNHINDQIDRFGVLWANEFKELIQTIVDELEETWWYSDSWILKETKGFHNKFNKALNRWRKLYLAANIMIVEARAVMDDPTVQQGSEMGKDAKRQHAIGLKQRELLKNDNSYSSQSEFYVFRYLASEGFLPGYNFTRLPIRTFVGQRHEDRGEFISRSRFIALREFGPNNLIYHKGNKYRIGRMGLTDAESLNRSIKISQNSGYAFLDGEAEQANNDPITNTTLTGKDVEFRKDVIELSETDGNPQMRISCEEEERTSQGFIIDDYFNYTGGIESTKDVIIKKGGEPLLKIIHGPATNLIKLNRQWRRSPDEGFRMDKRTGKWLRNKDLENQDVADNAKTVMIFTYDTADTLLIQPLDNLDIDKDQILNLSYAVKRGIETMFQVEDREIGVSIVGNPERPNILIYESAEGSLGILSQFIKVPRKLKGLFERTYQILHFDLEARIESEKGKELPKATYEDLLSYFNQRHHDIMDRRSIKDVLEYLIDCEYLETQAGGDRESHYKALLEQYDKNSATELPLLKHLYKNCLALPDRAQVNIPGFYISADFVYDNPSGATIIFCDGSIHDKNIVQEVDTHKRQLLMDEGYDVIEWHHSEPIEELVKRRKDIFRKVC